MIPPPASADFMLHQSAGSGRYMAERALSVFKASGISYVDIAGAALG